VPGGQGDHPPGVGAAQGLGDLMVSTRVGDHAVSGLHVLDGHGAAFGGDRGSGGEARPPVNMGDPLPLGDDVAVRELGLLRRGPVRIEGFRPRGDERPGESVVEPALHAADHPCGGLPRVRADRDATVQLGPDDRRLLDWHCRHVSGDVLDGTLEHRRDLLRVRGDHRRGESGGELVPDHRDRTDLTDPSGCPDIVSDPLDRVTGHGGESVSESSHSGLEARVPGQHRRGQRPTLHGLGEGEEHVLQFPGDGIPRLHPCCDELGLTSVQNVTDSRSDRGLDIGCPPRERHELLLAVLDVADRLLYSSNSLE